MRHTAAAARRPRLAAGPRRRLPMNDTSTGSSPAPPPESPEDREPITGPIYTVSDTLSGPDRALVRRWQKHLANERLEERLYRTLAQRREGEEAEILTALADAEARHQEHWIMLLGDYADTR